MKSYLIVSENSSKVLLCSNAYPRPRSRGLVSVEFVAFDAVDSELEWVASGSVLNPNGYVIAVPVPSEFCEFPK